MVAIFEAPSIALQSVVSRAVQRLHPSVAKEGQGDGGVLDLGPLVKKSLVAALVASAVVLGVSVGLQDFLRLGSFPWMLGAYTLVLIAGVTPKGYLAGRSRFGVLGAAMVAGAAVRLVVGTVLVHAGYGTEGAMGGVLGGELVSIVVVFAALRLDKLTSNRGHPLEAHLRDAIGEGAVAAGMWGLVSLDVLAARHFLPGPTSGWYAAGATLAQLVMVAPAVLGSWAFPRLVGAGALRRPSRSRLPRLVVAAGAMVAVEVAVVDLLARPILRQVFDASYLGASAVLLPLLVGAAFLGLAGFLGQFLLARREVLPACVPWVGVLGFLAAVGVWNRSMDQIAVAEMSAAALSAALMLAVSLHGQRYQPGRSHAPVDLALLDADLDLTIVVPYYNPGAALEANLSRLLLVLRAAPLSFEVIAVCDGSTDGSEATIAHLEGEHLRNVILPANQGKGAALRVGLAAGRGRYLGFIDADGDLDPQLLRSFVALVELYEPDVVVGSKRHPLSEVHYPPLRWLYSIGFQYLVRMLFRLDVRDTQTGIKLLRRDVLSAVLPRLLEKRFAFDLELLAVARRLGYRRMLEAPVRIEQHFTSTVSIRSVFATLLDTAAIFYRMRLLRFYDRIPSEPKREARLSPLIVKAVRPSASQPSTSSSH